MSSRYDCLVIGAGHNGLVTAGYLARAGRSVLVLEQHHIIGGCTVTEEIFPGCRVDTGAHGAGTMCSDIVKDLSLVQHGLEIVESDPCVFAPQPGGRHLIFSRDPARTSASIAQFSQRDADRWGDFTALVHQATTLLDTVYRTTPPNPVGGGAKDLLVLAGLGGRLRKLGRRDMTEVMRILPMTAQELLDEWFETDALKGAIAAGGLVGAFQGPMSAGTAFTFLHHHVGVPLGVIRPHYHVRGGTGKLADALAAAAVHQGADIRTDAAVDRILVENRRAVGVVLGTGEELRAGTIVSSANPRHTLGELISPEELDPGTNRRIGNIRYRGACAKIHLLLSELPKFACLPHDGPHLHGVISIGPGIEYLERAYDAAKHGGFSERLHIEATIPTVIEPDRAPEGMHLMSLLIQFAPYHLGEGEWNAATRNQLADNAIATMAEYAPNVADAVIDRHVLSPLDLEQRFSLPEGNMYHGELAMDQLFFMRPIPECAQYRTPIAGLYLCGAGTHPGGGVNGYSGYNAARETLRNT